MSQTISSLATLLWPLIVLAALLAALVVFREPLMRRIRSAEAGSTVRIAGQELSVAELTEQQTKLVTDLQAQVVALREQVEELRGSAPAHAPAAGTESDAAPAKAMAGSTAGSATVVASAGKPVGAQLSRVTRLRPRSEPPAVVESPGSADSPERDGAQVPAQTRTEQHGMNGRGSAELPSYPPPWERHQDAARQPESSPATQPQPAAEPVKATAEAGPDFAGMAEPAGPSGAPAGTNGPRPSATGVLWVDDHPKNNAVEMDRLQRNRVYVDTARSTAEALDKLSGQRYQLIISDMARRENGQPVADAGLKLVRAVRALDPETPIVIFSRAYAERADGSVALAAGADVVTSSPIRLYEELRKLSMMG